MASEFRLIGDVELKAKLLGLQKNAASKIMRPAVSKGCRVIRKAVSDKLTPGNVLSQEATGLMRKALRIKVSRRRKDNDSYGKVYVSRKIMRWEPQYGGLHVPGNVAHLVEFGHGGPHPAPAHPFMRPSLDEKRGAALTEVENEARKRLSEMAR